MTQANLSGAEDLDIDNEESAEPLEDWEILTEIVMALVRDPKQVRVEWEYDKKETLYKYMIHVASEDIGKVIGKNGETVSLLRKLFGRIAASRHERIAIDVFDPTKTYPSKTLRTRAA